MRSRCASSGALRCHACTCGTYTCHSTMTGIYNRVKVYTRNVRYNVFSALADVSSCSVTEDQQGHRIRHFMPLLNDMVLHATSRLIETSVTRYRKHTDNGTRRGCFGESISRLLSASGRIGERGPLLHGTDVLTSQRGSGGVLDGRVPRVVYTLQGWVSVNWMFEEKKTRRYEGVLSTMVTDELKGSVIIYFKCLLFCWYHECSPSCLLLMWKHPHASVFESAINPSTRTFFHFISNTIFHAFLCILEIFCFNGTKVRTTSR